MANKKTLWASRSIRDHVYVEFHNCKPKLGAYGDYSVRNRTGLAYYGDFENTFGWAPKPGECVEMVSEY